MADCCFPVIVLLLTCVVWGSWLNCIATAHQDTCGIIRYLKFLEPEKGHSLKGHVFLNLSIGIHKQCEEQCLRERECVSINIGPTINNIRACELSDSDHFLDRKDLKARTGWTYRGTVNLCATYPCLNNGKCYLGYTDKTYLCECPAGYTGENCEKVCPVPLGMESGAIRDSQISASSIWTPHPRNPRNHAAHQARLHLKENANRSGSWSAQVNNLHQWLQVDLLDTTRVTRIATQGRNNTSQWVTKYKLQYREDGHVFKFYRLNGDNSDTVFHGNTNRDTVVYHQLNPIIEARYVRVVPVEWFRHISLRMELYTC